jgi:hypothetical protein
VPDETHQPRLWVRTQLTLDSIAAGRRALERSEATVSRVRAAISRADALLQRIHKLCAPYPVPPPPRVSLAAQEASRRHHSTPDDELEFT